jgi:hypothetical protein
MALFGPTPRQIRQARTDAAERDAVAAQEVTDGLLLALIDEIRGLRKDLAKAMETKRASGRGH